MIFTTKIGNHKAKKTQPAKWSAIKSIEKRKCENICAIQFDEIGDKKKQPQHIRYEFDQVTDSMRHAIENVMGTHTNGAKERMR